jgi:AraC family transcriptional regulator
MTGQFQGHFLGTQIGSRLFPNFAVVENRYAPHENLGTHSHARAFLSVSLEGSYRESYGSSDCFCHPGAAILHEAGESHANAFGPEGGRVLSIEFLPRYLAALAAFDFQPLSRKRIDSPYCWQLALQLERELGRGDLASELAIEGLTLQILAETFRLYPRPERRQSGAWLQAVKEALHDRYREPLTLSALAEEARVHPVHLARTFSKHFGCSVGDYLRRLRLIAACNDLAHSGLSIAQIAARNGFSDQSHLTRAVKRHTGASPRQFRTRRVSKTLSPFKC